MKGTQTIVIPYIAIVILIIGISSTIYVHANQRGLIKNPETININGEIFQINLLFDTYPTTSIDTHDGEKTGIPLSSILLETDLSCPTCHIYTLRASDGYQQTVDWDDIETGILTREKRAYFPELAHSFWVKDIIQIEVN